MAFFADDCVLEMPRGGRALGNALRGQAQRTRRASDAL
nr:MULTISPECIES: hypothetical protein [Mesorhizobium]